MNDVDHRWQHPWLRIQLLLRAMLGTRWDHQTWPAIKAEMKKALEMRSRIQRAGWSASASVDRTNRTAYIAEPASSTS